MMLANDCLCALNRAVKILAPMFCFPLSAKFVTSTEKKLKTAFKSAPMVPSGIILKI